MPEELLLAIVFEMGSVDSILGTGLNQASFTDFEGSFRLPPFEVYFFKYKRIKTKRVLLCFQWSVSLGPQQTPKLVCLTTWKQSPRLGSGKDLILFPFSHNSSPVNTRLIKHDSLLGAILFYKLTSC